MPYFPTYVSITSSNRFDYVYNYTDHLGNIRLSYSRPQTGVTTILEENHYYPFGMKHINYGMDKNRYVLNPDKTPMYAVLEPVERSNYQYKYNGKEYQDEFSLNWYDYQARNYDPAIGRWMNIDPLAELSRRFNPYAYALNNPVYFIDPDGMLSLSFIENLWNKSGSNTNWINNDNGTFSGSNGASIDSGETDPPVFGHKPKVPDSKIGKYINSLSQKLDGKRKSAAENLVKKYEFNEDVIMANSFVMYALMEVTEAGDLLTFIREQIIETYGNENQKQNSEIFSKAVDLVKQIKSEVKGGKLTDLYIYKTVTLIGMKTIGLQIDNEAILLTIKSLDKGVYYDSKIDPTDKDPGGRGGFKGGGYSGGGSGGDY